MFFSKSRNLVGLDIGSSCIKVVELKETKKGNEFQLVKIGTEPLSPEAIVDGAIMDGGQVSEVIRKLFDRLNIRTNDVAIALSGHSVIIKRIQLPVMSEEERESMPAKDFKGFREKETPNSSLSQVAFSSSVASDSPKTMPGSRAASELLDSPPNKLVWPEFLDLASN